MGQERAGRLEMKELNLMLLYYPTLQKYLPILNLGTISINPNVHTFTSSHRKRPIDPTAQVST